MKNSPKIKRITAG